MTELLSVSDIQGELLVRGLKRGAKIFSEHVPHISQSREHKEGSKGLDGIPPQGEIFAQSGGDGGFDIPPEAPQVMRIHN